MQPCLPPWVLAALLAAAAAAQEPTVAEVLRRHQDALGDAPPGWFVIEATVHTTPKENRRTFVRRQPFALRRETTREGDTTTAVHFCDGRVALRLLDDGKVALLEGEIARLIIEAACVDGLQFLDGKSAGMRLARGPRHALARLPGLPASAYDDTPVWPMAVNLACGTELRLYFDDDDGRLRGFANTAFAPQRNVRFAEWQQLGPLRLPTVCYENRGAGATVRVQVDAVRRIEPEPDLFAAIPVTPAGADLDAGPLLFSPMEIPGSCYLVVPAIGIDRRVQITALFDTGAGRTYLATPMADSLGLPALSMRRVRGITGATGTAQRWLELLELPGHQFPQMEIGTLQFPPTVQDEYGAWPGAVLGGEILQRGPVFDRKRGRLHLRTTPIAPLTGENVFTVPLIIDDHDNLSEVAIEIDGHRVNAVVDSGQSTLLRLRPAGLRLAKLPLDAASWYERGAVSLQATGAGASATTDLVVQLDSFRLGCVTFERPTVQIALGGDPNATEYAAAIGAGALAVFDRVGFDLEHGRLEFQPGTMLVADGDGWRAPSAGTFLGLRAVEPNAAERERGERWPTVVEVAPGSPAAVAGVERGDRLHTIDGESCAVPVRDWRRRLWARADVTIELHRRGSEVRLVLKP